MELHQSNGISVIVLNDGENRFNPTFVQRINELLDEVEKASQSKALVFTGTGKFFSNGLDLTWMGQNAGGVEGLLDSIWHLLARILVFPLPTAAIINGHTYGAGMFLALACDVRVMRKDRGFLCLPEANLGLPLRKFKYLALAKLSKEAQRNMVLGGIKLDAVAALKLQVVDAIEEEDALVATATKLLTPFLGKRRTTVTTLKKELYDPYYNGLRTAEAKL